MELKTKHEVGDKVWFINNNEVVCWPIHQITINVLSKEETKAHPEKRGLIKTGNIVLDGIKTTYSLIRPGTNLFHYLQETALFKTKEALIKHLSK